MPFSHGFRLFWLLALAGLVQAQASPGGGGGAGLGVMTAADFDPVESVSVCPVASCVTSVITKDMIRASGMRKLADVFRLVPGFTVGSKSRHFQTVTYNGMADEYSRRLQVLVNGRSIYNAGPGNVFWGSLPVKLADIERIEVIRGASGALHGTNAFLATINIITPRATEVTGTTAETRVGSNGVRDLYLQHGQWLDERSALSVSLHRMADDGYAGMDDGADARSLLLRWDAQVAATDRVALEMGLSKTDLELDFGEGDARNREMADESYFYHGLWERELDNGRLSLRGHFKRAVWNDDGYLEQYQGVPLQVEKGARADRYDIELRHRWRLARDLRLNWGLGQRHDEVVSDAFFHDTGEMDRDLARVFANLEWQLAARTDLALGVMHERFSGDLDPVTSPLVSLRQGLAPGHDLLFSLGTGSRAPLAYETDGLLVAEIPGTGLGFTQVEATGDVTVESATSVSAAYRWRSGPKRYLALRVFRDRFSDLVTAYYRPVERVDPVTGNTFPGEVMDFVTAEDEVVVRGVELDGRWDLTRDDWLAFAVASSDIDADPSPTNYGYERTAPDHTLSLLYTHRFSPAVEGSLNYIHVGDMRWYIDSDLEAYEILNARIGRTIDLGARDVEVELIGQNLLGDYADYLPGRRWDREVMLRVSGYF